MQEDDSVQSLSHGEVSIEIFDEDNSLGMSQNASGYYYKSGAEKRSLWLRNYQNQLDKEQTSTILESPITESQNKKVFTQNQTQLQDQVVFLSESSVEKQQHERVNLTKNNKTNQEESQQQDQNIFRRKKESLEALKGTDAADTYFVDLNDNIPIHQEKSSNVEEPSNIIQSHEYKIENVTSKYPMEASKDRETEPMRISASNNIQNQTQNIRKISVSNGLNKITIAQSQQIIERKPSGNNYLRQESKRPGNTPNNNSTFSNNNNNQWKKKNKSALINLFNIGVIKSVIAHMRQHLISRKIQNLSESNLKLINDFSFTIQNQETSQKNIILLAKIFSFLPNILPVFQPDSLLFIVWSILVLITILVQVFCIPLEVSFKVGLRDGDFLLGFVYVIEMFVNFNVGYFEEGVVVKDRVKIVIRYFRLQFWMDLTTSIAFFLNTDHEILMLDLIFMMRMANIAILYKEIMQYFQFYRYQAFVDFVTLLFWTILMAHYMGCGFHFVSNSGTGTWIELMQLQNSHWWERYVYSIYFSFVTMSTIGYGDIYPVSVIEKVYVIVMLVIGCGWFAYVINSAGQIFSEIQLKQKEIREKQFKILEYMRSRNVSKNLQLKIVKYLDFMINKESNSNSHGEKILETMSKDLREQVLRECYKPILKKHFLFRNYFTEPFLDKLIAHMKEANLGPGEQVFNQNDSERVLFFVKEGKVDLMLASPTTQESFLISTLQNDQFFGDNQFFQITHQNPYSAVCSQQSSLVFLSLDDFLEIGNSFPKDMESYYQLKDKSLWSRSIHDCEICKQGKHDFLKCPAVFYNPKELLFIYRLNKDTPHYDRVSKQRNHSKGLNSLKERSYIQQLARQFRMTLECIIQGQETTDHNQIDSNPQSAQKIEDKENKNNNISIPMDQILEDGDSRTDSQSNQLNDSKCNHKKTPQSKVSREGIQIKKSLLCKPFHNNNSERDDQGLVIVSKRMKRMQFPRDLIEEGNDKEFFKGCVQLEFLDGEWQQCSEFESDSAEEDTDYLPKEPSIKTDEKDGSDIEPGQQSEGDHGKTLTGQRTLNLQQQQQLQNQQIHQLEQELQQDDKSINSPILNNPSYKYTHKKLSVVNAEMIPEESYSVLLNDSDIIPAPQQEISHKQIARNNNVSIPSLQPSNSSKFTQKPHNNNNEQMSLSAMPDFEFSPQNQQRHLVPAEDGGFNSMAKAANANPRRHSRLATRNQGDFMIQRAGKKRTYIDTSQQLQPHEFGLSQSSDIMQLSGGLGQEARKLMVNSSAFQYLNRYARNSSKSSTNVVMSVSALNPQLQQFFLPMDQSIISPEEQHRTQKNKLSLVAAQNNQQKSFQLIGNSLEDLQFNSNNNIMANGSGSLHQLQQTTAPGQTTILQPITSKQQIDDGGGGGGGGGGAYGLSRRNAINNMCRAATQVGTIYPGELAHALQFSCIAKLDAMRMYKVYFPSFNHDQVLKSCRRNNLNKLKIINQSKKTKKLIGNVREGGLQTLQSQSMLKISKMNNNNNNNIHLGSMHNNGNGMVNYKNESSSSISVNLSNNQYNNSTQNGQSITRSKYKFNTTKINNSTNAENYQFQSQLNPSLNLLNISSHQDEQ